MIDVCRLPRLAIKRLTCYTETSRALLIGKKGVKRSIAAYYGGEEKRRKTIGASEFIQFCLYFFSLL